MTPFDPFTALGLPPQALVGRRVPKTLLIENGCFASGDRRRIREGIDALRWLAVLKPTTVGIAEYRDSEREYLEIAVLMLDLRPNARRARLVEIVHRAVPYPVLLISRGQGAPEVSLVHKRRSLRDPSRIVIDGELVVVQVDSPRHLPPSRNSGTPSPWNGSLAAPSTPSTKAGSTPSMRFAQPVSRAASPFPLTLAQPPTDKRPSQNTGTSWSPLRRYIPVPPRKHRWPAGPT